MTISVALATFGDPAFWLPLADRAAASVPPGVELIRVHLDGADPGLCGAARNAAIAQATGSHIVTLDADDVLAPGYVESMEPHLAPDAVLVPWVAALREDGSVSAPHGIAHAPSTAVRNRNVVVGSCFPRAQWERQPFDERLPCLEDAAFWLDCELAGLRFVDVPGAVYCASRRPNGRRLTKGRDRVWADVYRERMGRKVA